MVQLKMLETDQSYFLAEVNNVTRKTLFIFAKNGCNDQIDASSLRLDPTHGFIYWKRECLIQKLRQKI